MGRTGGSFLGRCCPVGAASSCSLLLSPCWDPCRLESQTGRHSSVHKPGRHSSSAQTWQAQFSGWPRWFLTRVTRGDPDTLTGQGPTRCPNETETEAWAGRRSEREWGKPPGGAEAVYEPWEPSSSLNYFRTESGWGGSAAQDYS